MRLHTQRLMQQLTTVYHYTIHLFALICYCFYFSICLTYPQIFAFLSCGKTQSISKTKEVSLTNLYEHKISQVFTVFLLFCPSFLCSELHRCAMFCLLQVGTEIHDTDLVIVDRTLTDICFDEPVIL